MSTLTVSINTPEGIAPDELGRVLGDLATRLPSAPRNAPIALHADDGRQVGEALLTDDKVSHG